MRRIASGLVIAGLCLATPRAEAGPWVPEQGHGYLKLWARWLAGFGYHDASGNTVSYGAYHEVSLNAYAEVGLGAGFMVWANSPFVSTFTLSDPRAGGETHTHVAFGDSTLGARYGIVRRGPFRLAVGAFVRAPIAPSGEVQDVYAREGDQRRIGGLRIGNGAWDVGGELTAGYGWSRVYTAASVAWTWRSDGFDPVLSYTAEGGVSITARWSARLRVTGYHSVAIGSALRHNSPSGIGNGTRYVGFALETDYRVGRRSYVGLTFEGGVAAIERQTGGPVTSLYYATQF
ncbi:MAG: hypothetical protein R3A52_31690 [Polyangiales bacterium]